MRDVAVIGVGMQPWGELWEKSLRTLFVEAALDAIKDAGVDRIDSMHIGCMTPGLFTGQEHIGAVMADYLGVKGIPASRVESACASSGLAFRIGYMEVASGLNDIVLVGGVEKMTDVGGDEATYALATAADQEYESFLGATFPGLYALIANAHMHKYGTTSRQLAAVAAKNHEHGLRNPKAQFRMKVTVEQVLESVMVADPLHILDCSPITDGASAVILAPLDLAKKLGRKPLVKVAGTGHATDTIALAQRDDMTWLGAVEQAARQACKQAGVTPSDCDLMEVHDCFTIAEICVLEALGITEKGQGGKAAESGMTALGGKLPVNVSGGLKSKGHPVGATGTAQVIEVVTQLRGAAGERQVKNARRGLTQNMGGTGGSCLVHILEAV